MREWNKPQLLSLGVENTFDKDPTKNQHYCHKDNTWHANNCSSWNEGHYQSGSKCPSGGNHEWAGESHKSNCCCAGYETQQS